MVLSARAGERMVGTLAEYLKKILLSFTCLITRCFMTGAVQNSFAVKALCNVYDEPYETTNVGRLAIFEVSRKIVFV